ncbi:hypothetical protein PUMCH_000358 [Australozyma saopauloensis]|uniref:diacylglycerol O-acyltransferase n=1 Tax=Australozyma saopauloensis TaxID=291208 RepID=A0AAX4H3Y9_9ASCO|nr:hypothetical protein PUMCH_000358 [[Candida] saopauloensis]
MSTGSKAGASLRGVRNRNNARAAEKTAQKTRSKTGSVIKDTEAEDLDGGLELNNGARKKGKATKARLWPPINVAPLNTPLKRRLQTLAVTWHTVSIPSFFALFFFVLYLGWVAWLFIVVPYFIWFYGFDLHTPTNGKVVYRVRDWMRNLVLWEWFVNYFPITVHKTCDLEPTFTTEYVQVETTPSDEEDLVSENSRTPIDKIFKFFGLQKRLNDMDLSSVSESLETEDDSKKSTTHKLRKLSVGPRYIFGYHPHGVISMGVMGLFATNIVRNEPFKPFMKFLKPLFHDPSKGERLFPGVGYIFPLTLTTQFTVPFFRDYLLSMGLTSASAKNIKSIINNGDNSVCLVVGGAQESLLNDVVGNHRRISMGYNEVQEPDDVNDPTYTKQIRLVLQKRKGFVKLAIELGNVSLVPVFAFGEADIYKLSKPQPGSFGYKFQQWMKKTFHFTLPFFSARGIFFYDFGFIPYRTPINIVTGRPIYVPSGLLQDQAEPSPVTKPRLSSFTSLLKLNRSKTHVRRQIPQDILDHYHRLYVDELRRIYECNKDKFGYGDVELKIIE